MGISDDELKAIEASAVLILERGCRIEPTIASEVLILCADLREAREALLEVGARRVRLEMEVIEYEKYLGEEMVLQIRDKARKALGEEK